MSWTLKDTFFTFATFGFYAIGKGIKYGIDAYESIKEAQRIAKELSKLQSNTRDDIANLPTIKGATNQTATGKTQPFVIGRALNTPLILNTGKGSSKGYHTIAGSNGEKCYYNVVLTNGFNDQIIERIFCDDVTLAKLYTDTPQNGIFPFAANSAFAGEDSYLEINQNGGDFKNNEFNKKCVEQSVSDQIEKQYDWNENKSEKIENPNYKELFYTLEQNTMSADVCIMFNGLLSYNESGTKGSQTRTIIPSYSTDYAKILAEGGDVSKAEWHAFTFQRGTFHNTHTMLEKSGVFTSSVPGGYFYKKPSGKRDGYQYSEEELINAIQSHKDTWKLLSGDSSIKDDYTDFSYTLINEHASKYNIPRSVYDVSITLKKYNTTPGFYGDVINSNEFSASISSQIRFNAHIDFKYEDVKNLEYPITLRIQSPDTKAKTGSTVDDCYVQWIHSWTYDEYESKNQNKFIPEKNIETRAAQLSTLLGLHIQSTEANKEKLSSIQTVSTGIAKIYDSDKKEWTTDKRITSNPASWLLEVLTSSKHPASQIDFESEINLGKFAKWYEYCEAYNLKVNYVITQGMAKSAIIELICNCGHAAMYRDSDGLISVAIDGIKEDTEDMPLLNEQNLVSFHYEKQLKRKVDGVSVSFIDSENNYQKNNFVLMYERYQTIDGKKVDLWTYPEKRPFDSVIKEINVDGITTKEQAKQHALYVMKCDKLRPKTCIAQVGKENGLWDLLQKCKVQHPSLKIGLGSATIKNVIVASGTIIGFDLYSPIELDTEESFNIIVQCVGTYSGKQYCSPRSFSIQGFDGRTDEIYLTEESRISVTENIIPSAGDILSYGYEIETVTSDMLISAIAPNGTYGYTLTLIDYNEKIVDDSEEIPLYIPNLTQPKKPMGELPQALPAPTMDDVIKLTESATVGSKYTLDLSPEVQTIPVDSNGNKSVEWFYLSAYLYCMDVLCEDVEYSAYIDGAKVGSWDGNKVKISASYLKGDILEIEVKAIYDGIQRAATATVSKLYAGESGDLVLYKMHFPDGEKIKVNAGRTKYEPKKIRVYKKKNTTAGEFDTNFGYITTEFVPDGQEQKFETYTKVTEDFDSKEEYFAQYTPFLLKLDDDTVLGDENKNGLVFFERVK